MKWFYEVIVSIGAYKLCDYSKADEFVELTTWIITPEVFILVFNRNWFVGVFYFS